MMLFYKEFTEILATNYNHRVEFLLPDKTCIPSHYHITDVGSVHRYFIDCGGQRRNENYLQIQLWLGNDKEHRLTTQMILKILQRSEVVLKKLPDLQNSNIFIEYKTELLSQYPITKMELLNKKIVCYTEALTTQCLATLRHKQEKKEEEKTSYCCVANCC